MLANSFGGDSDSSTDSSDKGIRSPGYVPALRSVWFAKCDRPRTRLGTRTVRDERQATRVLFRYEELLAGRDRILLGSRHQRLGFGQG